MLNSCIAEETTSSKTFSLINLFQNKYFVIPDYQRGYSWEKEHLDDLLEDIINISRLDHTHYTGTIVAAKRNSDINLYEVVDGQQRLTTLVILLSCIYHKDQEKYREIKALYMLRGESGNERCALELNNETKDCFFTTVICSRNFQPIVKSHQRIIDAKKHFNQWLGSLNEQDLSLDLVYATVTEKLSFLFHTPRLDNEIGIMFEVINNRGKQLSELEKIKNYLIYYATVHNKKRLRDAINSNWKTIQENLSYAGRTSNDDENTFLRNCYIVFIDANKEKSWHVYDQCKKIFDVKRVKPTTNGQPPETEMEHFVTFLADASRYYAWFYNQRFFGISYSGENKSNLDKLLLYLRCQPVNASIMPLYLAIMSQLSDYDKASQVSSLLDVLEKVNMRLYVLPNVFKRADSKQGEIFSLANKFYKDGLNNSENSIFESLTQDLIKITKDNCSLGQIEKSLRLASDDRYDFYRWNGLRYLLGCYEEEILGEQAKRSFDFNRILTGRKAAKLTNDYLSIEHIWASKHLVEDFPEDFYGKRRLGNFVLCAMGSNSGLKNKSIEEKVAVLERTCTTSNGAMDMMQIAELKSLLEEATKQVQETRKKRTKNFWRDVAFHLASKKEEDLIAFAQRRWKFSDEEVNTHLKDNEVK